MNSNWFEFMGPVAGTGPCNILLGPSCEQVHGTGPCDQLKRNQLLISILSSHNSACSCFKMATPEQSSEQIEQNTSEQAGNSSSCIITRSNRVFFFAALKTIFTR